MSVDVGYALLVGWRVLDVICLSFEWGGVLSSSHLLNGARKIPLVVGLVAVVLLASTPQLLPGEGLDEGEQSYSINSGSGMVLSVVLGVPWPRHGLLMHGRWHC